MSIKRVIVLAALFTGGMSQAALADEDPGESGIALGEEFSYTVNVYENTMYLIFETARHETVRHRINLSNNIDVNGNVDELDNPKGYTDDYLYFKAGRQGAGCH